MATASELQNQAVRLDSELSLVMDQLIHMRLGLEEIEAAAAVHKLPSEMTAAIVKTQVQLVVGSLEGTMKAMDAAVDSFGMFFGK